jgi:nitrate/nitrite-specific signal transduction histidine kinase
VFFLAFVLSAALYSVLHQQASMRISNPGEYITDVSLIMVLFGAAFAGMTAVGVGLWCIKVTHRLCGPLLVMRNYLNEVKEGQIPRPRALRKKDEFKEFYATFTQAMKRMENDRESHIESLEAALSILETCAESEDSKRGEAVAMAKSKLDHMLQDCRKSLSTLQPSPQDQPAAVPVGALAKT